MRYPMHPKSFSENASVWNVDTLRTSRPPKMASENATITPRPHASGLAANESAWKRFIGPSAEVAVAGRIEPVRTTGLSVFTVRLRK